MEDGYKDPKPEDTLMCMDCGKTGILRSQLDQHDKECPNKPIDQKKH
jgi:hypothetical protein